MKEFQPSSTAIFVMNGIWHTTKNPRLGNEVPERLAHYNNLLMSEPLSLIRDFFLSLKAWLLQLLSIPGIYLHFVVRKKCIEQSIHSLLASDTSQVVVVGAGFDTLGLRLLESYPELQVFEIDHPATQNVKREKLATVLKNFPNLSFIELDLTKQSMEKALMGFKKYDANKKTVFVAEGLMMYLSLKDIKIFFESVINSNTLKSDIVFTCMEENKPGDYQFKNASMFVNFWLGLKKEKFSWGVHRDLLSDFLKDVGFELSQIKTTDDFRLEQLSEKNKNAPLAMGENVVYATQM